MKNAKKVLAMVIVLALAISMAIPASAADPKTTTLTINGQAGVEYDIYQMAVLTQNGEAYSYVANDAWIEFFEAQKVTRDGVPTDAFDVAEGNNVLTARADLTDVELKAIAEAAIVYAEGKDLAKTTVEIEAGETSVSTNLATGYYAIESSMGTRVIVDTLDNDNTTVTEKSDIPTLTKKVSGNDAGEDKIDAVDVAVGETVTYTITVSVKTGAEGYYVIDEIPAGITFGGAVTTNIAGVTVNATKVADTANTYKFDIVGEETIAIPYDDVNKTYGTVDLVLTYTGTVTSGVAIDAANQNSATLFYGKDAEGNAFESTNDTASVYTWSIDLKKFATGVDYLADAVFEIYDQDPYAQYEEGQEPAPLKFTEVAGKGYVFSGATGETQFTTNGTGVLTFSGLDSEKTYYFKEVDAPAGYNALIDSEDVAISKTVNGEVITAEYAVNGEDIDDNVLEVENKAGVVLPSTGGTGTVIFVVVGSFLVLAMGVLLVVRKRMSKVVYTR